MAGLTQEQKDKVINEAQKYGGVDSEAFKNKVNTQYGTGSYDTLVNKASQGVTTGQISGDLTKSNQELGTNVSQQQVDLAKQIGTGTFTAEQAKQYNTLTGSSTGARDLALSTQQGASNMQTTLTPEEQAKTTQVSTPTTPVKTETPKPTTTTDITYSEDKTAYNPNNVISKAPIFTGGDGKQYQTVRNNDNTLTTIDVSSGQAVTGKYTDAEREQIKQSFLQSSKPEVTADDIYNNLKVGVSVDKNSTGYAEAKTRYDNYSKYAGYSSKQFQTALNEGLILPGTQTYNDLIKDPKIKLELDKAQSLNIINGQKTDTTKVFETQSEEIANNTKVNIGGETMTLKQAMTDGYISQDEYNQITNNSEVVSKYKEVEGLKNKVNELQSQYDNIKSQVEEDIKNSGKRVSDSTKRALIANYQTKQLGPLNLAISNLNTANGTLTQLKTDATQMFATNLEIYQNQQAREQALQDLADQRKYQAQLTAEERAYNEQQAQKELEQKYNYTYGDINSTDPKIQNIAITNAVKSMYEKYPLPGMESQAIKVQKIKDKIAQGMTGTQAIQEVENEIRNSNRYKQFLASEQAKITPETKYSFTEMGGNLYRTDSKGNIALAVTGPKKYTKLDDGTYQDEQGNIVTKDDIQQNKLLNNSYLTASSGTNVGVECGQFARTAVGLTSTPGGNSLQERIKQFSDQTPAPGGLVLFNGGGYDKTYGHIAVVTGINNDGTINIKESNLNGDKKVTERTISANDANISGYYNNTPLTGTTGSTGTKQYTDAQLGLLSTIDNLTPTNSKALKDAGLTSEDYGLFKNGGLKPTLSQVAVAKSMVDKIDTLLKHSNLSDAVGTFDVRTPTISGKTNDFINKYNAFVANLAKDNLGVLKGPMSDKDIQFIKEMSTEINMNTDEQTFKDNLEKLKSQYEKIANGQSLNDAKSGNDNIGRVKGSTGGRIKK